MDEFDDNPCFPPEDERREFEQLAVEVTPL